MCSQRDWLEELFVPEENLPAYPGDPLLGDEDPWNQWEPLEADLKTTSFETKPPRLRPSDYLRTSTTHQRISSGIPTLDGVLGGGLVPGYLHALVGAPGSFKTSLACQVGLSLAQRGHRVVMLLADESPASLIERFYRLAGSSTPFEELKGNQKHPDRSLLDSLDLEILNATDTLKYALEEVAHRRNDGLPAVLIIDSLQKVAQKSWRAGDLRDEVMRALNALEAAIKSTGVIALVLSKASRVSYMTSRPGVASIASAADTSYIESDADVLLCLKQGKFPNTSELSVLKHRAAEVGGTVHFRLDRPAQCLRALTPEDALAQEDISRERYLCEKTESKAKKKKKQEEARRRKERTNREVLLAALKNCMEASEAALRGSTGLGTEPLKRALRTLEVEGKATWRASRGAHLWRALEPTASPGSAGCVCGPPFNPPLNKSTLVKISRRQTKAIQRESAKRLLLDEMRDGSEHL